MNFTRLHRRQVLRAAAAGAATAVFASDALAQAVAPTPTEAVSFDAFVAFDPRPVFARAEELFPGKGEEISNLWRTRQFEYAWLRTLSGRYVDFWKVTEDALVYAAASAKVELTRDKREQLMQKYLTMNCYPDVLPGLQTLRRAGLRLAFVSNMTERMLEAAIRRSGLEGVFEHVLSTDRVQAYKPDPRAYHMAIEAFGLAREDIVFAAFGGWDAAGAKSFGYRTFWCNRLKLPTEQLDVLPDAAGDDMTDLARFLRLT